MNSSAMKNMERAAAFSLYLLVVFSLPKMIVMRVSVEECFLCLVVAMAVLGVLIGVLGAYLSAPTSVVERGRVWEFVERRLRWGSVGVVQK